MCPISNSILDTSGQVNPWAKFWGDVNEGGIHDNIIGSQNAIFGAKLDREFSTNRSLAKLVGEENGELKPLIQNPTSL